MIFIEIRCDKCQTVGISRHCFYAHQLRQELKAQGWKCIEAGGKDYCPKCKLSAAQPAVTARPDDGAEGLATPPGQRPSAPRTDAEG